MTYKTKVSLLTAVVLIALYSYNFYYEHQEKEAEVEAGKEIETNTNEYFLPTSTTGQIIHHNGYSLSYSEPHEQAEWVAYELKKSHLSNTDFERPYKQNLNAFRKLVFSTSFNARIRINGLPSSGATVSGTVSYNGPKFLNSIFKIFIITQTSMV